MREKLIPSRSKRALDLAAAGAALAGFLAIAAAILFFARPPGALAKIPPSLKGPVATVGDRKVDAVDIIQAGKALAGRAGRDMTPASWRRYLMNRCIDRELLGMEAARRGFAADPTVRDRVANREFHLMKRELLAKVLIPGIVPSPTEFAQIKEKGLHQYIDLDYILVRDDARGAGRQLSERIANRARSGGSWDSLARMYSGHPPSAAGGGHFGPVLVRDLDPASHAEIVAGSVGDIFGPYSNPYGHDIYKIGAFIPIDDDSLMRLLLDERTRKIWIRNDEYLLDKYHFSPEPRAARRALRALHSETPESLLASLGPDGMRPEQGLRVALGIVARADGDSVTIADIFRDAPPATNERHVADIDDEKALTRLSSHVLLPRLLVRDARERGVDKDPTIARTLRLIRDEEATRAMVTSARPPDPDAAALRAYVEEHAARYRWPTARHATVIMFPSADSARAALRAWNGVGVPADTALSRLGFRRMKRPGVSLPQAGWMDSHLLYENGVDPLSISVRGLEPGQFAPVTRMAQGWAVICVTGREESRAMSDDEAAPRALRDWRGEADDRWVTALLERLRAKTAAKVIPARLEAVHLIDAESKRGAGS